MRVIWAVIAKEFGGYFKTYTSYIVLAVYLFLSLAATFYAGYFFEYDNSSLISFFMYQPVLLNLLLPALTMKMWAEERKQGTLEFLLTQPVSYRKFVWGKFLAAWMYALFLLMMTLPFVWYVSKLIPLDILNIVSAYIGVILTMATLCALGCLVSAVNSNVILAYLSTVFCGWVFESVNFNFLLRPVKEVFPLLSDRLNGILNFSNHYHQMIQGQLSIEGVGYFIILTLIALSLNVIVIGRRRG